jgi:hypothetical protein
MFSNSKYPVVRVASWHISKVINAKNRVTGKAIRDAVKADPGLEFVDTVSGQTMTVAEAKQAGAITLNVRYNNDRDMEPIPVK